MCYSIKLDRITRLLYPGRCHSLGIITKSKLVRINSQVPISNTKYISELFMNVTFSYFCYSYRLYAKWEYLYIYILNQMLGSWWYFNHEMWFENPIFRLRVMSMWSLFGILVKALAFHSGDRGSIPGRLTKCYVHWNHHKLPSYQLCSLW